MTTRERWLVLAGTLILLISLGYAYVWIPLRQAEVGHLDRIERLMRLEDAIARIPLSTVMSGSDGDPKPRQTLAALIETTATTNGLVLTGLTSASGGVVETKVDAGAFDKVVLWLSELETEQSVRIKRLSIRAAADEGIVTVEVALADETAAQSKETNE